MAVGAAGDDRESRWRAVAATVLSVAYAAALAAASWNGAMDGDDDGAPIVPAIVTIVVWCAATVLLGYLLPRLAFAIVLVAIVVPAFVGERAEEFDNELRYFNWLLMAVINTALVAVGAWRAGRR